MPGQFHHGSPGTTTASDIRTSVRGVLKQRSSTISTGSSSDRLHTRQVVAVEYRLCGLAGRILGQVSDDVDEVGPGRRSGSGTPDELLVRVVREVVGEEMRLSASSAAEGLEKSGWSGRWDAVLVGVRRDRKQRSDRR